MSPDLPPADDPRVLVFERDAPPALLPRLRIAFGLACVASVAGLALVGGLLYTDAFEFAMQNLPGSPPSEPSVALAAGLALTWPWVLFSSWCRRRADRYYGRVELHGGFARARRPWIWRNRLGRAVDHRFANVEAFEVRSHGVVVKGLGGIPTTSDAESAQIVELLSDYSETDEYQASVDNDWGTALFLALRAVVWVVGGVCVLSAVGLFFKDLGDGGWPPEPPKRLWLYAVPVTLVIFVFANLWCLRFGGDRRREQLVVFRVLPGGYSLGYGTCTPFAHLRRAARVGPYLLLHWLGANGKEREGLHYIGEGCGELWEQLAPRLSPEAIVEAEAFEWYRPQTFKRRAIALATSTVVSLLQVVVLLLSKAP